MKKSLLIGTGIAQVLCVTGAHAQTPAAAPQDRVAQIEEVVVTANRREQRLQDVPAAVTAVSATELARSGVSNTFQLTQTIPALNLTRATTSTQATIRGVGTRSTAPGDETNVAIYVDGVYQPSMAAATFNLLNVERVEVLRGPQGTLFGRNSTGGLINIITTDPDQDFEFRGVASYGSYNARSGQVYLSGPLASTVSANLTALWSKDDGYLRDILRNKRSSPREDVALRGKLRFQPTEAADIKFTLGYVRSLDSVALNPTPYMGNTRARSLANNPGVLLPSGPYQVAPTRVPNAELTQYSAVLDGRFDLGGVSLQNTMAYQEDEGGGTTDSDGTPVLVGVASNFNSTFSRFYTDELRLISTAPGPLKWIAGAYYFNGRGRFNPIISSTATADTLIFSDQRTQSYSGFAEATYDFTQALSLTAGLRYTSERRKFAGRSLTGAGAVLSTVDTNDKFGRWTYRAILQYKINPDVNVYASYSRGFKSGVFNSFSTAPTSKATRPELLDAYEIGLKSDPLPWLRLNLSAFHYDYQDIQLSARDSATNLVVLLNAASAKIDGGEIELTAAVTPNLNVRAYATVLDAKYKNFPGAQIFTILYQDQSAIGRSAMTPIGNNQSLADQSGKDMIRAPDYTLGLSGDYTVETEAGDFSISANLYRTAKFYWDVNNRLAQPAYTMVNGELSWSPRDSRFTVSVWGKNLTDAVVFQSLVGTAIADLVTYDRPRTVGVSARFNY